MVNGTAVLVRNLTIVQGSSWSQAWQFRLDGQPFIDATWTVKAQVRARTSDPVVLHEWSTAAGNAIIDAQGHVTLTVAPAVSSAWVWPTASATYDLEVSKAGVTHRLLQGSVRLDPEVTR